MADVYKNKKTFWMTLLFDPDAMFNEDVEWKVVVVIGSSSFMKDLNSQSRI